MNETPRQESYGEVADAAVDLYAMLHLDPQAPLPEIEEALGCAQRWWNAQQANPKYRRQAPEALARLREARELLLDPLRRQEYDRHLQSFRQAHRELRWQPIRDLLAVVLRHQRLTDEDEDLVRRFAQRRGLPPPEISALIEEELLRKGARRPSLLVRAPSTSMSPPRRRLGYHIAASLLFASVLCLLYLSFRDHFRSAVLLGLPLLNTLRLLARGWLYNERPKESQHNAWDWSLGVILFGGATGAALADIYFSVLFPLGVVTASLLWMGWFLLVWLWRRTPLAQEQPPPTLPESSPYP